MKPSAMSRRAHAATDGKQRHHSLFATRATGCPATLPVRWLPLALLAWLAAVTAVHAEAYLPAIGGGGGGQFKAPCEQGLLLAGFELHVGDDVDAIRPLCAIAIGERQVDTQAAATRWYGGTGGSVESLLCPSSTPVVTGLYVAAEGESTVIVNTIHLYCGLASRAQASAGEYPSAVFDGPTIRGVKFSFPGFVGRDNHFRGARQDCPSGQVAVGVHGRHGVWLDEVGLICGDTGIPQPATARERTPPKPPVALGRVKSRAMPLEGAAVVLVEPSTATEHAVKASNATRAVADPPICSNARQARARNSPAAPALEAQCRAAGGTP